MVDEVGEKPPRTKEERRKRQKKLEQARRRRQTENAPAAPAPAGTEVGTEPGEPPAKRRGRPKRRPIMASDLQGLKCFENLAPLLERLHDVGCYYFPGLASEAELLKHIEKLKPQDTT